MSHVRPTPDTTRHPPTARRGTDPWPADEGFAGYTTPRFRDTPTGRFVTRIFRVCASLQLAIFLLSFFAFCLAAATLIESAYSAAIAQELIYHTWWFALLLFLLAVNILCAALKKYPWKRHQTGFLITHAGLIVLVFGGLLTTLAGVEGQMMMIDTDDRDVQQAFRMANQSDTIQLAGRYQIEVYRIPKEQARHDDQLLKDILPVLRGGVEMGDDLKRKLRGHHWALSLSPGSFAWHADEHFRPQLPWMLQALSVVANPFPGFSRQLDDNTTLTVENYYPHTESQPFSPAAAGEEGFSALQLRLTTPMTPRPMTRWVTSMPRFDPDPSPVAFELFILHDLALLDEFLAPPPPDELGNNGQLVLAVGHRRRICRLSLDRLKEGEPVDLEGTGLRFTLKKRGELRDLLGHEPDKAAQFQPSYPAVQFELSGPGGTGTYLACARLPHLPAFQEGEDIERIACWYHHPDFRWGEKHRMGALQFLHAPGGKVYYRVYGKDGLKEKGRELDTSDPAAHQLPWKPMNMSFEVLAWLPRAVSREHVIPRQVRPGAELAERLEPALRCTLTCNGESKEFWVRMSRSATQTIVGKEMFFVRYRQDARRLDFALTLQKARQISDPGTNRPAAFQSDVVLSYESDGQKVLKEHTISMNHTLDHGGYKVYQTNYRPLTDPRTGALLLDSRGNLVSMSGLTVADDPGLYCKYAGSLLLVLGIATMFYMRAYFFKPRPRPTPRG